MELEEARIREALASVPTPDGARGLALSGRLSPLALDDGRVSFAIAVDAAEAAQWETVRRAAEAAVANVPGVRKVIAVLTAERASGQSEEGERRSTTGAAAQPRSGTPTARTAKAAMASLAGVHHIIAVASGKGGVGKSTTACNLALALAAGGRRVGILDADIYGPSMPKLMGITRQPRILTGRMLEPLESFGVKVMSIGFLVDAGKAMIWRGPMVASAVTQLLRDVAWGSLDVLVVDMPPGTGDAQLTLAEKAGLSGAVIVSTPQDLALIDARRGIAMFRDVGVPVLGLVENMSYFVCDSCGKRHHPFASGGARQEAASLGVAFLGEVPLDSAIRERSDAGRPIVATEPESAGAKAFRDIADGVVSGLAAADRATGG